MKKKWFRISEELRICFTGVKFSINEKFCQADRHIKTYTARQAKFLLAQRFSKKLGYGIHAICIDKALIEEVNIEKDSKVKELIIT